MAGLVHNSCHLKWTEYYNEYNDPLCTDANCDCKVRYNSLHIRYIRAVEEEDMYLARHIEKQIHPGILHVFVGKVRKHATSKFKIKYYQEVLRPDFEPMLFIDKSYQIEWMMWNLIEDDIQYNANTVEKLFSNERLTSPDQMKRLLGSLKVEQDMHWKTAAQVLFNGRPDLISLRAPVLLEFLLGEIPTKSSLHEHISKIWNAKSEKEKKADVEYLARYNNISDELIKFAGGVKLCLDAETSPNVVERIVSGAPQEIREVVFECPYNHFLIMVKYVGREKILEWFELTEEKPFIGYDMVACYLIHFSDTQEQGLKVCRCFDATYSHPEHVANAMYKRWGPSYEVDAILFEN